jgi:hypothetical protein
MAKDIYNRDQVPVGGIFSSERAIITVSGAGSLGVGALVQNISASYAQQLSEIYEIGSNFVYRQTGRPVGRLTIGRIVGSGEFAEALFDACTGGGTVSIQAANGLCSGANPAGLTRTMYGVIITNYGIDLSTQDLMVRESLEATFTSMTR